METVNRDCLVSAICAATGDVFSTMLGLPVEAGPHYTEQAGCQGVDGVIALVGIAGAWTGSGRISCTAAFACRLSGAMLASEYTAVNEDVLDAMAELANMIIGNVKSVLEERLGPLGLSVPTVIFGRNYQTRSAGVSEWMVVPFRSEGELFEVKFALFRTPAADSLRAPLRDAGIRLNQEIRMSEPNRPSPLAQVAGDGRADGGRGSGGRRFVVHDATVRGAGRCWVREGARPDREMPSEESGHVH